MSLISDLIDKKITAEDAAKKAVGNNEALSELLENILSKKDEIRIDMIDKIKGLR